MTYTKEQIEELLKKAGEADAEYKVFGAKSHKYRLNPTVTIEEVRKFEEKAKLKLPDDYVYFLTHIGNGGAGPYYGLYALDELEYEENDAKEEFINSDLDTKKWNEAIKLMEDDSQYDEIYKKLTKDAIVIGTQGCTYDSILMCGGSEKGKIIYIDWNLQYDYPPFLTKMTFWEWYVGFFEDIISGYSEKSYGYRKRATEEELIEAIKAASDYNEKKYLLSSFMRFDRLSAKTIEYLCEAEDEETSDIRLYLLLHYETETGMKIFDKMINGENISAAVRCIRNIPKEKYDDYYKKALKILQMKEHVSETILYYFSNCISKKASDFIEFAREVSENDKLKRTAIWLIGTCNDASDYEEDFISWMKSDDFYIAHQSLQSSIGFEIRSDRLMDTYQWMAEKYKNNSIMRSNLKRVL